MSKTKHIVLLVADILFVLSIFVSLTISPWMRGNDFALVVEILIPFIVLLAWRIINNVLTISRNTPMIGPIEAAFMTMVAIVFVVLTISTSAQFIFFALFWLIFSFVFSTKKIYYRFVKYILIILGILVPIYLEYSFSTGPDQCQECVMGANLVIVVFIMFYLFFSFFLLAFLRRINKINQNKNIPEDVK